MHIDSNAQQTEQQTEPRQPGASTDSPTQSTPDGSDRDDWWTRLAAKFRHEAAAHRAGGRGTVSQALLPRSA